MTVSIYKEVFDELLNRVVQLSIDVEHERDMRRTAERRLVEAATPQIDPRLVHEMIGAIVADRKIEAIKAHRALTGYGLKESKEAIERVTNRFASTAA